MRNELLGYLVGALETDEQSRVENELRTDRQLQSDMEVLKRGLAPVEIDKALIEPSQGLARRTIDYVFFQLALATQGPRALEPSVTRAPVWNESAPPSRKWRFADLSAAAGILIAAFSIVVPALNISRANSERMACANRLQQAHVAIAGFADFNNGQMPGPQPRPGFESKAGIYGPQITDADFLKDHEALVCPGSDLARREFRVPSIAQLRAARGRELDQFISIMGGSYGIRIGYVDSSGRYC
jgi:hypothetical protein